MGLCNGFAIPVAQRTGAGDGHNMRRFVANSAYLCLFFSVALTAVTVLGCRWILRVMQTPAELFNDAYAYIFIMFLGIPVIILYNMLSGIIRSLGDSKTPVYFLALSSVLNIVLDLAFVMFVIVLLKSKLPVWVSLIGSFGVYMGLLSLLS